MAAQEGPDDIRAFQGNGVGDLDPDKHADALQKVVDDRGVLSVGGVLVDNADPANPIIKKGASFFASNLNATPITLTTDTVNPAFFGPLKIDYSDGISLLDAATGTVKNDSGRTISMLGSINYNPDKGGGGTTTLTIVSETATSLGGPWVGNLQSKRTVEISNNSESFGSKVSVVIDLAPGQLLRFRGWISGGTLQFVSSSEVGLGQTFFSPSIAWGLIEM